jgi:hypothetical protein
MADSTDFDWMDKASCRKFDPDIWFTGRRGPNNHDQYDDAIEICLGCPVLLNCEKYILRLERNVSVQYRYGIYAGMTVEDRLAMESRRLRRAS